MLLPTLASAADPVYNPLGQLGSQRDNQNRNRDAANRARNAGNDSIGRGLRNMRHGRAHHHPPEVRVGALQVLEGILGLVASAVANKLSNKSDINGDNLDQLPSSAQSSAAQAAAGQDGAGGPGSFTGRGAGADASGASAKGGKLSTGDLANPDVKSALSLLHDEFGYTQEELLKKLENGDDPKGILENAPKNALTAEELAAAAKAARKEDPAGTAGDASLALAGAAASPAAAVAAPTGAGAPGAAGAGAGGSGDSNVMQFGGRSGLRDALSRSLSGKDEDDPELSPEVRAALAAREAEERARNRMVKPAEEMDLFEVIHLKYQEREKNLRWGEPLRTAESGQL